jgi:ABC-type amino acid transport substrate-binding protein
LVLKKNDVLLWGTGGYDKPAQVDEFVQGISAKDPELSQQQFTVSEIPIFYDSVHFAAAKNHYKEVLKKIDAAISAAKKNGSLNKIPSVNH